MDIGDTIAPNSDQLDAIDLMTGPRTFTITDVTKGNAEQPVQIALAEFDRPWRPGKSMRRVLVAVWGSDASAYKGRRVTLYCDPEVRFGKDKVGGTRISHLSHIDGPKSVQLLVSRGKSATYVVEPLPNESTPQADITNDTIAACESIPTLRGWWKGADAGTRKLIEARVKALEEEALGRDDALAQGVDSPADLDPEADKQIALDA
jgi:hypothetical protein